MKAVCFSLCAVLIIGICAPVATASGTAGTEPADQAALFTDLKSSDALYPYIRFLTLKGIVTGYGDGTVRPGDPLTRAEAAVIVARAAGLSSADGGTPVFSDVNAGYWAFGFIQVAAGKGLLSGYPDGSFGPDKKITRAEAAALLMKLSGGALTDKAQAIPGVPESSWACKPVSTALQAGVMTLPSGAVFGPDTAILRGEMSESLAKLFVLGPSLRSCALTGTLTVQSGTVTVDGTAAASGATIGAGNTVKTGADGKAMVDYSDGSSLLILPGTEITVTQSKGLYYITSDGTPGVTVDKLEISQQNGDLFGALSSRHAEKTGSAVSAGPLSWWDEPYAVRTRMEIDSANSIVEIKGTFWHNLLAPQGSATTSVLTGTVVVNAGGQTEILAPSQVVTISSQGQPPSPPAPLTPVQIQQWGQQQSWVASAAQQIQQNVPPMRPTAGQGSPGEAQAIGGALQQLQQQAQQQQQQQCYITPLSTPPKPAFSNYHASWNTIVAYAVKYTVKLYRDGACVQNADRQVDTSALSVDFSDFMSAAGSYTATVTANPAPGSPYMNSAESQPSAAVVRPAAPTGGVSDSTANTFTCAINPDFTVISDYEYSLDSGANWTTCTQVPGTNCVISVGLLYSGPVWVRVKANLGTNRLDGVVLMGTFTR